MVLLVSFTAGSQKEALPLSCSTICYFHICIYLWLYFQQGNEIIIRSAENPINYLCNGTSLILSYFYRWIWLNITVQNRSLSDLLFWNWGEEFQNSAIPPLDSFFTVWCKGRRRNSSILERKYETKKSERCTGGPCMYLDFEFLLQVSDNLNQPSQAAVVTCPLPSCRAQAL